MFGDGGVEKDPHIYTASPSEGVHGGVIMSKLGNATAKYVNTTRLHLRATYVRPIVELSLVARRGNCCEPHYSR